MRSLALILVFSGALAAHAAEPATALDRVIAAASKTPQWEDAKTQADRLGALRYQALKYHAVSEVVSDRYLITVLAGPVDLVRFFNLARIICSTSKHRRTILAGQWKREHGDSLKEGDIDAELFPDDLPSNALGALFGEEIHAHNADRSYDLGAALRKFLGALQPVPDSVTAKYPHERLLHGLSNDSPIEARRASQAWYTAEPLYLVPVVAPERVKDLPDAAAALKAAGLEVRRFENQPILIERIGSPAPQTVSKETILMRVPASEKAAPKFPKAVPVDEEYPKAVPVPDRP